MQPQCDGRGKLPCPKCGGAKLTLTRDGRPCRCIACGGKGHAGACAGCERCKAAKAAKGSDQGRFQW